MEYHHAVHLVSEDSLEYFKSSPEQTVETCDYDKFATAPLNAPFLVKRMDIHIVCYDTRQMGATYNEIRPEKPPRSINPVFATGVATIVRDETFPCGVQLGRKSHSEIVSQRLHRVETDDTVDGAIDEDQFELDRKSDLNSSLDSFLRLLEVPEFDGRPARKLVLPRDLVTKYRLDVPPEKRAIPMRGNLHSTKAVVANHYSPHHWFLYGEESLAAIYRLNVSQRREVWRKRKRECRL